MPSASALAFALIFRCQKASGEDSLRLNRDVGTRGPWPASSLSVIIDYSFLMFFRPSNFPQRTVKLLNCRPVFMASMSDLILPNLILPNPLLHRTPGYNSEGTVDENTVGDMFSSTLAVSLRLAPAITSCPSYAVKSF